MSPQKKKNKVGRGHVTFHTSTPPTLWKSSEDRGVLKNASPSPLWEDHKIVSWSSAATLRGDGVSAATLRSNGVSANAGRRDDKAKLESENHNARAIIQPLLDTENSFVKEVECFLQQRDAAELRRKELLHKRWTEEVWMPAQSIVEENISQRSLSNTEGLRSMFMDYIQHCNAKGSVFLDSYDSKEYDPFLLRSTTPRVSEITSPASRDPLLLHSRERLKERRTALSCQTGCRRARCEVEPRVPPCSESGCRRARCEVEPRVPPCSESGRRRARCEVEPRVPYHTTAAATPDGRCHRLGCWSARR